MNFLAHLWLAGEDDGLRLGAILGDFVRGKKALSAFDPNVVRGIMLHRHIDTMMDMVPGVRKLRASFRPPFRRYSGIVIDIAFDHELALRWEQYSDISLEQFDQEVRDLLAMHDDLVPEQLRRFMRYADRRGLFASYRSESEVLHSLAGISRRLTRPNPLDRSGEIWPELKPRITASFEEVFSLVQSDVTAWLSDRSTITGS